MIILNKICIAILKDLISNDEYIKTSELAQKYKVTDRTIRYNLEKIEKFLAKNGFDYLDRQRLKGIRIVKSDKLKKFIEEFCGTYTPYKYVYSKEEKVKFIIVRLLQSEKPVKLDYFESKLYISKSTLIKDLDFIEKYMYKKDLRLIRRTRVGLYVEGKENIKRRLLNQIVSETVTIKDIYNYTKESNTFSKISNLEFETLFEGIDIDFIDKLILNAEKDLDKEFNDTDYGNLITHIAIMIKRIQLKKKIYLPQVDIENMLEHKEFYIAQNMVNKIEKKYKIEIPEEEIAYITLRFLGAKVIKDNEKDACKEESGLYGVAEKMTKKIETIYNVNFEKNRDKLVEGLVMHLRPTIYRIKFKLTLENPLFNEMKQKYSNLLKNTECAVKYLEEYIGERVSEHEISYIALHFGAALENAKPNEKIPRVIIVCGTGIGTAKMLATQLKKYFNVELVNTVSTRELKSIDRIQYDVVISTIDIPQLDNNDYIKVSPILTKNDFEKLKDKLIIKENMFDYNEIIDKTNRLLEVTSKYCNISKVYMPLQYEFMKILFGSNEDVKNEEEIGIENLINSETIKLHVECKNWRQAIKAGVDILKDKKFVKEEYAESIIRTIENLGPYMVIAPGVILSHGKPQCGVLVQSISLAVLKNGVNFNDDFKTDVRLIITLAALNKENSGKILSQIMGLVSNKEDINKILNASTKKEVLEIIKKYSKSKNVYK